MKTTMRNDEDDINSKAYHIILKQKFGKKIGGLRRMNQENREQEVERSRMMTDERKVSEERQTDVARSLGQK